MSIELWGAGPGTSRRARLLLSGALGIAACSLTFSAALLLGRGLAGSAALTTLLLPVAISGALAVGLVVSFVATTALQNPRSRRRVGRAVGVVVPLAAAVALFVYAADPTAVPAAGDTPTADFVRRTPISPPRTIGVPEEPPAPAPGEPPEPVGPGTVPAGPGVPGAGPGAPAGPGVPGALPPLAGPVVPPDDTAGEPPIDRPGSGLQDPGAPPVQQPPVQQPPAKRPRGAPRPPAVDTPDVEPRDTTPRVRPRATPPKAKPAGRGKGPKRPQPACAKAKGRPAVCTNPRATASPR